MSRLRVRAPIIAADVHAFAAAAQSGRLCFGLDQVAAIVGLTPAFLEAGCRQLLVEHVDYHDTLSMTVEQVQKLLFRLGSDGDLTDEVLIEAFLCDQSQPECLNRLLWAVK